MALLPKNILDYWKIGFMRRMMHCIYFLIKFRLIIRKLCGGNAMFVGICGQQHPIIERMEGDALIVVKKIIRIL